MCFNKFNSVLALLLLQAAAPQRTHQLNKYASNSSLPQEQLSQSLSYSGSRLRSGSGSPPVLDESGGISAAPSGARKQAKSSDQTRSADTEGTPSYSVDSFEDSVGFLLANICTHFVNVWHWLYTTRLNCGV